MSAPRTNIETQKRRHVVPLVGMALVAVFGLGLIIYWQFEEAAEGLPAATEAPEDLPSTTPPGDDAAPAESAPPATGQAD